MKMIYRVKKAFPTLLVLYEIMVCSQAAESIHVPTVAQIPPTQAQGIVTVPSSTMPVPRQIEAVLPSPKYETKIELGATNITQNYDDENPNKHRPILPSPNSRLKGPFFEEGSELTHVTARVGSTINLDCRIGLLGDKTVTWTQVKNQNINLLTVGKNTHSKDERIHLAFRYPNNYRLQISYVTKRDEGMYACQVATYPPKVKRIHLTITAPEVEIVDESGRVVHERHYRQGSSLLLTCLATSVGFLENEPDKNIISWKHGARILSQGSSLNVTKDSDSAVSVLTITPLEKRHSGNYTCNVGNLAARTVAVHVINGELPAAVQTAGVHFKSSNSTLLLVIFTFCSLLR
ncbi:neuronal growth regulator 1-like [Rhynchophorus ferrugineus]|uniref:neuronal growth regulator 1-like n=1 Tax=Rhynchophorus ferrugineus TaxID=354439 RepID=UPI003FCD6095